MYGVVVTSPLNEAEIMHIVYVEEKIPLLFIKRVPVSNRTKLTKEQRKDLEKVIGLNFIYSFCTYFLFSLWLVNFIFTFPTGKVFEVHQSFNTKKDSLNCN